MDRRRFLSQAAAASASITAFQVDAAEGTSKLKTRSSSSQPLWSWSATDLAQSIRDGKITSRQATESALQRLSEVNPTINAVVETLSDEALAAADAADKQTQNTPRSKLAPLHGVPVTTKINVDYAGRATTNGIVALKGAIAKEDSSPVANLRKGGAVIFGRTNVPAFSFRWFSDNDLHGQTLNPWNKTLTPGGSSGGAASAVASGIGALAHGNDIGGSIRYPAYCCGVVGIRPSIGRVAGYNPSSGNMPRPIAVQLMAVEGLIARNVADLRVSLPVLAARDVRDSWWSEAAVSPKRLPPRTRVAILARLPGVKVDPSVAKGLEVAARALTSAGYIVEEVVPPQFAETADMWSGFALSEFGRGFRAVAEKIGDARIRKALGTWIDITKLSDFADFSKMLGVREQVRTAWRVFMEKYPVVVTPVSWKAPFPLDYDQQGPDVFREILLAQGPLFVVPFLGLPALSVPTGIQAGVPTGVQIIADHFCEGHCFDIGEAIESAVRPTTPVDPLG
ncbi:amidase [Hydrogenophaga sp. YM1]|uniref:amidase n=1 Tax=Hydrogenophaga sp. YM1 TaxID=2806262 RepID=UPI00195B6523|nr:amidase [Hydrogenophaga sp. YM1]QRR35609.1 amidase [Hydrogenophaga sp. YM1]